MRITCTWFDIGEHPPSHPHPCGLSLKNKDDLYKRERERERESTRMRRGGWTLVFASVKPGAHGENSVYKSGNLRAQLTLKRHERGTLSVIRCAQLALFEFCCSENAKRGDFVTFLIFTFRNDKE